jgi:hypothetical protein
MSKPRRNLDQFGAWRHLLDAAPAAPTASSSLLSFTPYVAKPFSPATLKINIFGYWKGASGSILRFEKGPSNAITVTGTALDEKVKGTGSVEGERLKLRLTLQVKRLELTVDLGMPGGEYDYQSDEMSGTASDADGTERSVKLSRMGTDVQGTWREGSESSLSFAEPILDWYDGEQQVRLDVKGYIFGRQGKGTVKSWGRNITGTLKATDFSHHNEYLNAHLWARNYKKSYQRDCPKEGWWASDALGLSLKMCPDGSFLAGTVTPFGRDDDHEIEVHVQLGRGNASTGSAPRSYL